jgi:hypothetical protein
LLFFGTNRLPRAVGSSDVKPAVAGVEKNDSGAWAARRGARAARRHRCSPRRTQTSCRRWSCGGLAWLLWIEGVESAMFEDVVVVEKRDMARRAPIGCFASSHTTTCENRFATSAPSKQRAVVTRQNRCSAGCDNGRRAQAAWLAAALNGVGRGGAGAARVRLYMEWLRAARPTLARAPASRAGEHTASIRRGRCATPATRAAARCGYVRAALAPRGQRH